MAGVGDRKLEINKTQSLLSKCLQYGRGIRLYSKNLLKKCFDLFSSMRPELENMHLF